MKIRLLLFSFAITALCIFVFSLASAQVYYQTSVEQGKQSLRVYMRLYDATYALDAEGASALSGALDGARVTFMDGGGTVLGDSSASEVTESHASREEVVQARLYGEGYAVRDSETLGVSMVYYCKSFPEQDLLVRIALAVPSEWSMFAKTLPTLAAYIAVDVVLCAAFAFAATHFVLTPVASLIKGASGEGKLEGRYAELQPIADILNERNRSIRRQLREIGEEQEAAERARASKDEFIANVTHEMNTPLTSIRGYAELLHAGALNKTQAEEAYGVILSQSERLIGLIAQIINYSEIGSDGLPPYEVDVSELARRMLRVLAPEAAERGVSLTGEIAENVKVRSRNELVEEVLSNLVRNAIRYNREGGTVTVRVAYGRIEVEDTGVGISQENLPKIFDRFFTADKSHGGAGGGFGLGLAVVKKICVQSGWKITAQSREGEGSVFTVCF